MDRQDQISKGPAKTMDKLLNDMIVEPKNWHLGTTNQKCKSDVAKHSQLIKIQG